MAEYGALIGLDNGNPFITPKSTPLALYKNGSMVSAYNSASAYSTHTAQLDITVPAGKPVMVFMHSNSPCAFTTTRVSSTTIRIMGISPDPDKGFTAFYFVFSKFPQPMIAEGIAIWDDTGELILTNETKVLTDINTIGVRGASDTGIAMNRTLSGRWAVSPIMTGFNEFRVGNQPTSPIVQVQTAFSSVFDGSNTKLTSQSTRGTFGYLLASQQNYRQPAIVIDVGKYV